MEGFGIIWEIDIYLKFIVFYDINLNPQLLTKVTLNSNLITRTTYYSPLIKGDQGGCPLVPLFTFF